MSKEKIRFIDLNSFASILAFTLWVITITVFISNILLYTLIFTITNTWYMLKTESILSDISIIYKILVSYSTIATLAYVIEVGVKKVYKKVRNKK